MTKIEQTIESLVTGADRPVSASHPAKLFVQWLVVTLLSTGLIVAFMVPRGDILQQLTAPVFDVEIGSLFLMIASTAMSAVWLCFPDLRQQSKIVFLPLLFVTSFALAGAYRSLHPEITVIPPPDKVCGIDCAGCVTLFSVIPGFWMFHILRRHATTYPAAAGALSFLAASSIGLLVLKLVESNDSVLHLLQWHISPMILLAIVGAALGKKYLAW